MGKKRTAKKKNKTPEEQQRAEEQRDRARVMEEAEAAAELLESGEWAFLNRICAAAGKEAAIALAKVLDDGTVTTKKGADVLLTQESQLLYAKILGFKLDFTRKFLESPHIALKKQAHREAKDIADQERLELEEEYEYKIRQENAE